MAHLDPTVHHRQSVTVDNVEFEPSAWISDNLGVIYTVIGISTGRARLQFDATPAELRTLALALVTQASVIEQLSEQENIPIDGVPLAKVQPTC